MDPEQLTMSESGQCVAKLLQIGGTALGMWGALLMANQYTSAVKRALDLAAVLMSAVFGGNKAKGLALVATLKAENRNQTMRGLGLVFLGFLLQSFGMIVDLFTFK